MGDGRASANAVVVEWCVQQGGNKAVKAVRRRTLYNMLPAALALHLQAGREGGEQGAVMRRVLPRERCTSSAPTVSCYGQGIGLLELEDYR